MKVDWKDNFKEVYKKLGQQKYGIRLFALWKTQSGMSQNQISSFLNRSPLAICHWRKLYESKGLDGLLEKRKGIGKKEF